MTEKLSLALKQYIPWAGVLTIVQLFLSCIYKARVTENKFDEYMVVVLPLCLIMHVILLAAFRFRCDKLLVMTILFLFHLGIILQLLVNPQNNEYSILFTNTGLLLMAAVGTVLFFFLLDRVEILVWERALVGVLLVMFLLLWMFGLELNGTKAWIRMGGISIQLTELIKLASLFLICFIYSEEDTSSGTKLLKVGVAVFLVGIGLFSLNETGTFLIILLVAIAISFFALPVSEFLMLSGGFIFLGLVGMLTLLIGNKTYISGGENAFSSMCFSIWQKILHRFELTYNPEAFDPYGIGFQALAADRSIRIGGLFGTSEFDIYIPVADAEYIAVFMCLKYGVLLLLFVILLYVGILFSGNRIAVRQKDPMQRLLAIAMSYVLALQSLITIAGSCGVLPLTGMPIAFLSKGYTNQLLCCVATFLLMKISSTIHKGRKKPWIIMRRHLLPKRKL